MAYNTGNPVPSTEAKDFVDNVENLDSFMNSLEASAPDRNGVLRTTWEGIVQGNGFFNVGTFAVGFTLTNSRQTLTHDGHEYSWSGVFPKVVASGSTPTPLGAGGWIDRSDITLRSKVIFSYPTVSEMASDLQLTPGAKARTYFYNDDVITDWEVVASGAGDLSDGTLALSNGLYAKILVSSPFSRPTINPLSMGVVRNDLSESNRLALRNCWFYCAANNIDIDMPIGAFPSIGTNVAIDNLHVYGSMPNKLSDLTALDATSGTVIKNSFSMAGENSNLVLDGLGFDCGSASVASARDALVVNGLTGTDDSATIKNVRIKNIRALGYSKASAFHTVLLQGIDGLEIDNIHTHYNHFGCVIKCQNVNAGKLFAERHGLVGVYPKSDDDTLSGGTYGKCRKVHIDSVIYSDDITETTSVACEIYASTLDLEEVHVGSVISTGGGYAAKVRGKSGVCSALRVKIDSIIGNNTYQDFLVDENVDNCVIGSIQTRNPRRGVIVETNANCKKVVIGSITGANLGSKAVANLDVVLRGEVTVNSVNVESNNATPQISVANASTIRVTQSNLKMSFEQNLSLINGYATYFDTPSIKREADGFRLYGRLNPASATADKICDIPSILSSPVGISVPVAMYANGVYTTTMLYLSGTSLQWLARSGTTSPVWIDLNGAFFKYP